MEQTICPGLPSVICTITTLTAHFTWGLLLDLTHVCIYYSYIMTASVGRKIVLLVKKK